MTVHTQSMAAPSRTFSEPSVTMTGLLWEIAIKKTRPQSVKAREADSLTGNGQRRIVVCTDCQ
jgi:hypothetical protein